MWVLFSLFVLLSRYWSVWLRLVFRLCYSYLSNIFKKSCQFTLSNCEVAL
jgi:hypothetical protein